MISSARAERVSIAETRLDSVLQKRILANVKQLEMKISESGPEHLRCDPHIVSSALRSLAKQKRLIKIVGPHGSEFYALARFYNENISQHISRKNDIFDLYQEYRHLACKQSLCGNIGEEMVWRAVTKTKEFIPIGNMQFPVEHFGTTKLSGKLDLILNHPGLGFWTLVEVKNTREWIYPSSRELWQLIQKSLDLRNLGIPIVPVIVARKINHSARLFFKRAGILGVETHRQVFHDSVNDRLIRIKHKDGLGFHDITTNGEPGNWLIDFFGETVLSEGKSVSQCFKGAEPILLSHAPTMSSGVKRPTRFKLWRTIALEFGMGTETADEDFVE